MEAPVSDNGADCEGEVIAGPSCVNTERRTPLTTESEGADGSLHNKVRQVRKRSLTRSKSRELSRIIEINNRTRQQYSKNRSGIINNKDNHHDNRSRSRERGTRERSRRRSRSPDRRTFRRTRVLRSRSKFNEDLSDDEVHGERKARRRHRDNSIDSDNSPIKRLKRRRSRSPSRRSYSELPQDIPDTTHGLLNKFLDVLTNVKGQSTSKLSLNNVVPEFDPMSKEQTIVTWLTKVEECADIYGWDERETIHFALPKLVGVAKRWYQGLSTLLYTWTEWKRKLIESFPCRQDYAEMLSEMLAKRARYGESLEQYYYTKINLLNRCNIISRRAVDCLLHGVDDRAVRIGAQAASFREPEDVLKYFRTVKPGNSREDKMSRDNKSNQSNDKSRIDNSKTTDNNIKCHNCNEDGHKSFKCSKPLTKCDACSKTGHLSQYCRTRLTNNHDVDRSCETADVKPEK